jgi:flagellar assembly protein FliH
MEWVGWGETDEEGPGANGEVPAPQPAPAVAEAALRAEFEQKLAEETRRAFESGRERGRGEGHAQEREAQAAALKAQEQKRVQQAAQQLESFAQERDRYLRQVEREVVELALAVATRILRREAQMDPLLLTGAVRVALGQLSQTTEVRLKVPPGELEMWTEAMAHLPNLAVKPKVLAGEGMRLGDCALETQVGTVDLGVRAQLGEIERGFFDRPGGHSMERTEPGRAAAPAEARK